MIQDTEPGDEPRRIVVAPNLSLSYRGAVAFFWWSLQPRGRFRDIITIEGERLYLERGLGRPKQYWTFSRAWVWVEQDPPTHRNHPVRLFLREGRRQQEIGQCLSGDERTSLGERLKAVMADKD